MKVTRKIETEIRKFMDDYWNSYFNGDLEHWANYLVDDYRNIGGTEEEIWNSKQEILDYSYRIIDQMKGVTELRNKQVQIIPYDPYVMVHELLDIYIKVQDEWRFYGKFRLSTLLQNTATGWKVLHQHGSYPDSKTAEGEAFAFDALKSENVKLKKAVADRTRQLEQKNRELEIEAALERVRARSLAMHHTSELQDVVNVVAQQLQQMGMHINGGVFLTINGEVDKDIPLWASSGMADYVQKVRVPFFDKPIVTDLINAIKKGNNFFDKTYSKEEKDEMFRHLFNFSPWNNLPDERMQELLSRKGGLTRTGAISQYTSIFITNHNGEEFSNNDTDILKRFGSIFEQSYIRFLDLQKAEAQAREAQIELGLERVRSRAMQMQSSDELNELIGIVFTELTKLDLVLTRCIMLIYEGSEKGVRWWMANSEAPATPMNFFVRYADMPFFNEYLKGWQDRTSKWQYILEGVNKIKTDDFLFRETELSQLPDFVIAGMRAPDRVYLNASFNNFGNLTLASLEPLSEEHFNILLRFAKVFDLTYTRFNDLKQAEAQAREAQIETALERVRSRTMGMQKSEELKEVIQLVNEQMVHLNLFVEHAGFIIDWSDTEYTIWLADKHVLPFKATIPYFDCAHWRSFRQAKKDGTAFFANYLDFDEKNKFYTDLFNVIPGVPQETRDYYKSCAGLAISTVLVDNVGLYIENFSGIPYTDEENSILMRFGKVFQQTYTRFLDLQGAEAQTREAQIEAALERVRSRTMAMQKSDELAETAAVMFGQLIHLGIEPNRLYIGIIEMDSKDIEMWATDEDGARIGKKFSFNADDNESVKKLYNGWLSQKKSVVVDMQGVELKNYIEYLKLLKIPLTHALTQERRVQTVSYFNQGFIGMAAATGPSIADVELLERFAAVFNLAYTRFNDLKIAEAHALKAEEDLVKLHEAKQRAEAALAELKATQTQLIQSEKMASLGELTAGIAHEIQNPLNFVNNFSEVNLELITDVKEELKQGNISDALEVTEDIEENLQKIAHHGKRADGIVKSMLQHSRKTSGEKEPTDINALVDEYLRLSYHGLRAKDNSFNCILETHFDPALGKLNINGQDIGRVLLNLFNNAFYAVNEKKKMAPKTGDGYEPLVTVSTQLSSSESRGAIITVKDNGTGIPSKVLEKIYQPFFTTKPTGEGTGLGLSLSYDIITKGHGGQLFVNTKEGEGTTFSIQL